MSCSKQREFVASSANYVHSKNVSFREAHLLVEYFLPRPSGFNGVFSITLHPAHYMYPCKHAVRAM